MLSDDEFKLLNTEAEGESEKTYITNWCWFLDFLLFMGLFLAGAVLLLVNISMTLHTDNNETDNKEPSLAIIYAQGRNDGWKEGGQEESKAGSEQTGLMTHKIRKPQPTLL